MEKKKKTSSRPKVDLVGMKRYLKTYTRVKYFFRAYKPFLNETAFYGAVFVS